MNNEVSPPLPSVKKAAVTAAGPSLIAQIERLRGEKRAGVFLIATDTSLPCLLNAGITPDAVISIDCQHISYYHFMDGLPAGVPLFLDLASPPLLSFLSKRNQFFSGGHPLTRYISRFYRPLPELDTSGGNVTYAAVSLAQELGAREIELYGADFSYPGGVSYARGTYIYPYFANRQNRFASLEAQASTFLFRTPLEKKTRPQAPASWYYETKALRFYREKLEEKSWRMDAVLIPVNSMGAPMNLRQGDNSRQRDLRIFSSGKPAMDAHEFLCFYRNGIASLNEPGKNAAEYLSSLKGEAQAVFATILPTAASLKQRHPHADFRELFEEARAHCLKAIDKMK